MIFFVSVYYVLSVLSYLKYCVIREAAAVTSA